MTVKYIGEVIYDVNPQDSSESANVIKGITIAVTGIDMYRNCLNCSAKVTEKNKYDPCRVWYVQHEDEDKTSVGIKVLLI